MNKRRESAFHLTEKKRKKKKTFLRNGAQEFVNERNLRGKEFFSHGR